MKDFMRKGIAAGLGLAIISKERTEKVVQELVKKGEMTPAASKELLDKLISRGEQERQELDSILRERIKKVLRDQDIASQDDILRLERRIEMLEAKVMTSDTLGEDGSKPDV